MTYTLRATLVLCAALVAAPAVAHPGHDHKVMGVITGVNGDYVTVRTPAGDERTFQITGKTQIQRGSVAGAREEIVVGRRVIVNVGDGQEPLRAKSVQYAAPAKRSGT